MEDQQLSFDDVITRQAFNAREVGIISVNSQIVEMPQPLLSAVHRANRIVRAGESQIDFAIAAERKDSPVRVKSSIRNLVNDDSGHVFTAIATADLHQHRMFEVVPREDRLRHFTMFLGATEQTVARASARKCTFGARQTFRCSEFPQVSA